MNTKKTILVLVMSTVVGMFSVSTTAMTVNWSASNDTFLTLEGGTIAVPSGGQLQLGLITTNAAALQLLQDDPVAVQSFFDAWATSSIGTGTGNVDGSYDIATISAGAGFFSQQAYLLVFNDTSAASATQIGLYTNPNWIFPASDPATAASFQLDAPGLQTIIGSYSAGTILTPEIIAGGNAVQLHDTLAVIPEPSTFLLVGFGLMGAMALRRRRS